MQEQEEIIRHKSCNQGAQQKANNQPLAHIANHVHKAIFKRFFHLLRKRLFLVFIVIIMVAGAVLAFAAAMFVLVMVFMMMFVAMFMRFTNDSNACFRLIFRDQIRKHAAKHCRHKSSNRAQNRKRSTQQRIRRQNRIHTRRRRRNQETHARTLACTFFTECNRCWDHATTANWERHTKQRRPKHRFKSWLRNFRYIQMVRHPHMQNAGKQKAEQQERRHLRKQRKELPNKLFQNF